jgi:hypothetical protein
MTLPLLEDLVALELLLDLAAVDLTHHFYLFECILQLISFVVSLNELLFPKLVLLAVWEPDKAVLFNGSLLPELTLDLLSNFVLHSLFSCLIVLHQVVSVLSD